MKRSVIFLIVLAILSIMVLTGCKGDNGAAGPAGQDGITGETGTTGPQGPAGPTLPSVTSTDPAHLATDVPLDAVIRATFSKPMSSATITTTTFTLKSEGVSIPGTISYNSGSKTAYFDPTSPLPAFSYITAELTGGISDGESNALQTYTWSFYTGNSYASSRLYVVNSGSSILEFNNAGAASGDIFSDRIISSASGTVNAPWGLWLDTASDRLYVASNTSNNIVVYNNASIANGNTAPARIISSATSTLNQANGLWLDSANDRLYVTGYASDNIVVYNNASIANGNTNPARIISSTGTLDGGEGIWLDSINDRLYVTGYNSNNIVVYNNASTANGNTVPTRIISSATTTLNTPDGLWLDTASDALYVANCVTDSVVVYNNASTANGNTNPARIITAGTTLNCPSGVWLDAATDRLYVSSNANSRILVFNNASAINGNVAPSRTITNVNSTLIAPKYIWLDNSGP